jgi:alcohol dehydrogenase
MANAAMLAGISFSNAMVGIVHSVGHALGGVCHLPHGMANSIVLPYGMEFNMEVASHLYAEIFHNVFPYEKPESAKVDTERLIEKVKELRKNLNKLCGLPVTLKEAGISEDTLGEVTAGALLDGTTIYNPKKITEHDVMSILKKAYE